MMTKKAIILCAGRGTRLMPFTNDKPKPLVEVNGQSILENSINNLINASYQSIIIVTGYKGQMINDIVSKYKSSIKIKCVYNEDWSTSNNIVSLWKVLDELQADVTLVDGDVFYNDSVLKAMNEMPTGKNYLVVSPLTSLMNGICVTESDLLINGFYNVKDKLTHHDKELLKTANICRISEGLCNYLKERLSQEIEVGNTYRFYDELFEEAFHSNFEFHAIKLPNHSYYEIDDAYDLKLCEFQFSNDKLHILQNQHGGYWRHPISDFALIYNFHFPPQTLKEKLKGSFESLMLNYPANSRYAIQHLAYFLSVPAEYLTIANGVSEFIKILPRIINGSVLLIEPGFNEYINCFEANSVEIYQLKESNNFKLDIDELISLVVEKNIQAVVLETPNNPTGRLIKKEDIIKLYIETEITKTLLVVDESFIDFSNEADSNGLILELERFPRILIFKSMSKTFGIGGLRIGYAATSDPRLMKRLKSELPIWNINSFAEEFILNLLPYRQNYLNSCKIVRQETDELLLNLKKIKELTVFDTDANFIFCKIKDKQFTAKQFAITLLNRFGIYIKECSGKGVVDAEYFFRVSSRSSQENRGLLEAMHSIFKGDVPNVH